jgi:hypothetical protein
MRVPCSVTDVSLEHDVSFDQPVGDPALPEREAHTPDALPGGEVTNAGDSGQGAWARFDQLYFQPFLVASPGVPSPSTV